MEKRHVTLTNGETIAYLEKGNGNHSILLIHGNFSSSLHYTPWMDGLTDNHKVIAPDLRGFGDSSYHQPIDALEDFADDLYDFLFIKGINKVDLIGWSLGGGVAMAFAARYPELTRRMVLINSTTHKGYPVFRKDAQGAPIIGEVYHSKEELALDPVQVLPLLTALKNQDALTMTYIWNLTIYTVKKPNEKDNQRWIAESLKQRNLVDADWALANFNMSSASNLYSKGNNTIKDIKAKTLHIWGENDIVVPEYMIKENIEALKEQSTYIKYPSCGHSPLVDVPELLTNDIIKFLK